MEHLVQGGMLHRDLAARNVLLFHFDENDPFCTSVKIGDFGLSVYSEYQSHVCTGGEDNRPVRHMAPEALKKAR
jgi:hypothetical protein